MRMCEYHIVVRWSTIADLSWDCSFKSLTIICNHSFLNVCLFVFLTLRMCPCHGTIPPLPHTKNSSGSGFFLLCVCLCVGACACACACVSFCTLTCECARMWVGERRLCFQ